MTSYEFPPLGGGAAKMAFGLARRLVASGDEVDVLTMGSTGLPREQEIEGISVFRVGTDRADQSVCSLGEAANYLTRGLWDIRALARQRRYQLVHSHFIFPDGVLAMYVAGGTGLPYVITAHGTDVPGHNPHRLRALHTLLRPLWARVTTRAAAIVCPSVVLAEKVRAANDRANVVVIANAFNADRFRPDQMRRPRVLSVSRMVKLKGLQYLLAAMAEVEQETEVVLVGDGPFAPDLRRLSKALQLDVRFTGWIDNDSARLKELYETAGIFVFPSEAENCPISLLEAMAAGLPIVTTDDLGCKGVVGDTAVLVPPRDSSAIAGAIDRLGRSEKLRRQLGAAARRRVVEHFGWDAHIGRYRTLYAKHV
ncbi:MAG: glycosyltransferase family 4 protein [Gammaproteobacteria bacterium]|nr:glycosyltransferase family 4 protein [Gammaproteobacteria bacterium]